VSFTGVSAHVSDDATLAKILFPTHLALVLWITMSFQMDLEVTLEAEGLVTVRTVELERNQINV